MNPFDILIQVLIIVATTAISYALAPRPSQGKPGAVTDLKDPTAEAGREIPVVWGEGRITGVNILWFGDKSARNYEISS